MLKRTYIGLSCSWHDSAIAVVDSLIATGARQNLPRFVQLLSPQQDRFRGTVSRPSPVNGPLERLRGCVRAGRLHAATEQPPVRTGNAAATLLL